MPDQYWINCSLLKRLISVLEKVEVGVHGNIYTYTHTHMLPWDTSGVNRYHNSSSVHRMLDSLGWPSLEQRRKTSRLGVMYTVYNGLVQCPIIKTKLVPPPPRQRRTHCQQLSLDHRHQNTVQRRFLFTLHHQGLEVSGTHPPLMQ